MKRFISIGLFFYLLIGPGCKVHKVTEGKDYFSQWKETGTVASHHSGFHYTDSLMQQWKKNLHGKILFWSPPDSSGQQYIRAEIDLQADTESESALFRSGMVSDTVYVAAKKEEAETTEKEWHQETTRESRSFNYFIFILFATFCVFNWFLSRTKIMNR